MNYPTIENCNYETDSPILMAARMRNPSPVLKEALEFLELTLVEHADNEYVISIEECRRAEQLVIDRLRGELRMTRRRSRE